MDTPLSMGQRLTMTKQRKSRPVVHLTASESGGVVRLEWSVQQLPNDGSVPKRPKCRLVWVTVGQTLNVPQLTQLMARMVAYVLPGLIGTVHVPRATSWREADSVFSLVPPSGGEGGEKADAGNTDRSADTAQVDPRLPSVLRRPVGVGGRERSDLVSSVDRGSEQLPGQLELPLVDEG